MQKGIRKKVEALNTREHVLIAVLDSGLGGLSICAELEKRLRSMCFTNRFRCFISTSGRSRAAAIIPLTVCPNESAYLTERWKV